ncbi:MAG: HEAT repeat domain-containing protein [Planctomycetaceae bacterium]|nr:HEAT repeat domain-containing protein [Planctomycetaceae bacterium]
MCRFHPLPIRPLTYLVFGFMCLLASVTQAGDFATDRLKKWQIEPTAKGVEAYLRSMVFDAEMRESAKGLINKLGSPNYRERKTAMAALAKLPVMPHRQLEEATNSPNAEVRVRARRLLTTTHRKFQVPKLVATLSFIEQRDVQGLTELIFQVLPEWQDPNLMNHAERALRTTVESDDADFLRRQITTQPSPFRELALVALGSALGREAIPELLPALQHNDPPMRLAAADAMADLGDRRSLPVLVELLDSEDVAVREKSAMVLRGLTGQRLGYSAHLPEKSRANAFRAWQQWYEVSGKTAKLTLPYPRPPVEMGRTLVCVWSSNLFKEVDANKRDVFTVPGFKYVWGCHATPDGRRLVIDSERKGVFEYDSSGRETWQRMDIPGRPTGVEGLENGNVLIACSETDRVVEIARDGRVVWEYEIKGRPTTAQRLSNGNTVINLQSAGKIVEVDQQGNLKTLLDGLDRVHTAQRLENGNLLVTEMGLHRVDEYDVHGKVIWSKAGLKNPAQAQRIANGNTLIADEDGIKEYNRSGDSVWHLPVTRSRFFRY